VFVLALKESAASVFLSGWFVCRWEVLINKNSSVARFIAEALFVFGPPRVSPSRLNCDREAAHLHFYWAIKRAHSSMLVYGFGFIEWAA
jgi:hypothetical protein